SSFDVIALPPLSRVFTCLCQRPRYAILASFSSMRVIEPVWARQNDAPTATTTGIRKTLRRLQIITPPELFLSRILKRVAAFDAPAFPPERTRSFVVCTRGCISGSIIPLTHPE